MYILYEMQTTANGTALVPTQTFTDRNQAESAWHAVMAAAAISNVTVHTALLVDEHGNTIKRGFYEHGAEAEE